MPDPGAGLAAGMGTGKPEALGARGPMTATLQSSDTAEACGAGELGALGECPSPTLQLGHLVP